MRRGGTAGRCTRRVELVHATFAEHPTGRCRPLSLALPPPPPCHPPRATSKPRRAHLASVRSHPKPPTPHPPATTSPPGPPGQCNSFRSWGTESIIISARARAFGELGKIKESYNSPKPLKHEAVGTHNCTPVPLWSTMPPPVRGSAKELKCSSKENRIP
jgi:hypothetical protein